MELLNGFYIQTDPRYKRGALKKKERESGKKFPPRTGDA
jgi:hypothetical protein